MEAWGFSFYALVRWAWLLSVMFEISTSLGKVGMASLVMLPHPPFLSSFHTIILVNNHKKFHQDMSVGFKVIDRLVFHLPSNKAKNKPSKIA